MNMNSILSNEIAKAYKPIDKQTETDLILKAKAGDTKAQNALVHSQLKRIVDIARGYVSYVNDLSDLISQGTIGLIKAIDSYDFDKAGSMRFHNYAQWWIRAEITYLVYDNQPLTVPRNKSKGNAEMKDENGNIIKEKVEPMRFNVLSINSPISDEDGFATFENIISSDEIGIDKTAEFAGIMNVLAQNLTKTELGIFKARVFDDATYEEIAAQFGIKTREGARVHTNKVFEKVSRICKKKIRN